MAKEVLKNTNSVEILSDNLKVSSSVVNPGFTSERKVFNVSGRFKKDAPVVVGTLNLTSSENDSLSKKGNIVPNSSNSNLNSTLKLKLKNTTQDANGNTTGYLYNLVYTPKENTSKANPLKYSIRTGRRKIAPAIVGGISNIDFGTDKIHKNGETRRIIITGDKNIAFKLQINKIEDIKNSAGNIIASNYTSILNTNLSKKEKGLLNNVSTEVETINFNSITGRSELSCKTDVNGKFVLNQKFAKTSSTVRYSIHLNEDTILSSSFNKTAWNKEVIGFENYYTVFLTQRINPTLIIRATTDVQTYSINAQAVDLKDSGQIYQRKYIGNSNGLPKGDSRYTTITYNLAVVDASNNIAKRGSAYPNGDPVFDNVDRNNDGTIVSSWANTNFETNGGADILIWGGNVDDNITGDSGNDKATVTFNLQINSMGTEDTTIITLDLDNHIVIS